MFEFTELSTRPQQFFSILPEDWRQEIEPVWSEYYQKAHIFGLTQADTVVAGGIVFQCPAPDTAFYQELAQEWFERGYYYVGFLFVSSPLRSCGLGSTLLRRILEYWPGKKYWLSIEDYRLADFYSRFGFKLVREIAGDAGSEWIMAQD